MGKSNSSKNKQAKGSSAATTAAPKKCTCDHPFQCQCGNRPERPSKGHKWYPEEQIWAGKGHKQKGASGQTALVAQKAKITDKGQTQVAQWQRLPSQLLQEYCQRQKRPNPKYKNIQKKQGSAAAAAADYKYRVIVCDAKGDDDKDLFFVPAQAVPNEEQAKEEGALLALLQLTPTLPHERKLPEPYKTTWLNAVEALKNKKDRATASSKRTATPPASNDNPSGKASSSSGGNNSSNNNNNGGGGKSAVASSNLTLGRTASLVGGMSKADRRRQQDEQRRQRNARIRKHDAIRMANQNHPVFMSRLIREQIESLLRGGEAGASALNWENGDDDDNDNSDDGGGDDPAAEDNDDEAKIYVEHRLHSEGFTKRQARSATQELLQSSEKFEQASDNEDLWDDLYEECLQWLLVHLNEDQLPEGFDPRGRMLDVIVSSAAASTATGRSETCAGDGDGDGDGDGNGAGTSAAERAGSMDLAARLGIMVKEATLISNLAAKENKSPLDVFWRTILRAAGMEVEANAAFSAADEATIDLMKDELEALEAIFPSECAVTANGGFTAIQLPLSDGALTLEVVVQDGLYPSSPPSRVTVSGTWPSRVGTAIHVELSKFLGDLPLGEPMVFAIHAHVQDLLLTEELSDRLSLLRHLGADEQQTKPGLTTEVKVSSGSMKPKAQDSTSSSEHKPAPLNVSLPQRRPRARGRNFWSTRPQETPPSVAFPQVGAAMERTRKSLPAASSRDEFLAAMKRAENGGRVLLVTGETGSGKSTQLPAYLLENDPKGAKIVVAQPRRLAATGVANRVAEERGESRAGDGSVGYVVRGDSAMCNRTRLLFCTTGVLLRQLQNEGALECVTHIVVDEVHERQLDTDVLLGFLRQSLSSYPNLCVILMSATMDSDRFSAYWGSTTPRIHIPGRTYPVTDHTLEEVLSLTGYIPSKKKKGGKKSFRYSSNRKKMSAWNDSEFSDVEEEEEEEETAAAEEDVEAAASSGTSVVKQGIPMEDLVARMDETSVDADLILRLVKHLIVSKASNDNGSILVFLPGAPEINNVLETIKRGTRDQAVLLLPLHGGLQPKEQSRVFHSAPTGFTKVVLSTNVAETSITIPDCTVVIDCCREKQASYDPVNRMPLLVEQFTSKASMKQRRGRAGRVREGTCYKLISRSTYASLKDHSEPEIMRVALDQTLLQLLFLGVETGSGNFMNTLLDPPSKESVDAASFSLRKLGAVGQGANEGELQLTPLGNHLAGIPAPPIVGKMLVMGCILGCRSAALAMAAGISLGRSPFLRIDAPRKSRDDENISMDDFKRQRALEERSNYFKTVGNSDHSMVAALFLKWKGTDAGGGARRKFCDSVGLSFTGMRDMFQLANQLDSSLKAAGFLATAESDRNAPSWRIIHACAVSAMAPSQLVKVRRPAMKYTETAEGAKAKDGEAKELKFFIRTKRQEERVFIHPSSANFSNGNYSCPFLVYNSMVRTSKPFLRDVTECSAYSLLLFGGDLEIRSSEGTIVIDDWAVLSANARIGALMGGLRRRVDTLMAEKVKNPLYEIAGSKEMQLIVKLIKTDGLGS